MGTFPLKISLTILQLDLDNQTRKRMYLMKISWVENVPHQNHTY